MNVMYLIYDLQHEEQIRIEKIGNIPLIYYEKSKNLKSKN
jgi:hypothetical protein